ncbi:hypothetical protein R1sor_016924 [Riccia sorocarpa]|uniref:Retrotransposon gag domain-containing protein n=1 Tax=Riccia sorocarpa TaxID=122646 RepID=A0ABD3HGA4_9MARC
MIFKQSCARRPFWRSFARKDILVIFWRSFAGKDILVIFWRSFARKDILVIIRRSCARRSFWRSSVREDVLTNPQRSLLTTIHQGEVRQINKLPDQIRQIDLHQNQEVTKSLPARLNDKDTPISVNRCNPGSPSSPEKYFLDGKWWLKSARRNLEREENIGSTVASEEDPPLVLPWEQYREEGVRYRLIETSGSDEEDCIFIATEDIVVDDLRDQELRNQPDAADLQDASSSNTQKGKEGETALGVAPIAPVPNPIAQPGVLPTVVIPMAEVPVRGVYPATNIPSPAMDIYYDGNSEFNGFISKFESIATVNNSPRDQWILLVRPYFRGGADVWFENLPDPTKRDYDLMVAAGKDRITKILQWQQIREYQDIHHILRVMHQAPGWPGQGVNPIPGWPGHGVNTAPRWPRHGASPIPGWPTPGGYHSVPACGYNTPTPPRGHVIEECNALKRAQAQRNGNQNPANVHTVTTTQPNPGSNDPNLDKGITGDNLFSVTAAEEIISKGVAQKEDGCVAQCAKDLFSWQNVLNLSS